jgi:hypothetical protein
MGIFENFLGKDVNSKSTSKVSGGGKRVTTSYKDGTSEDNTYDKHGGLLDITDHKRDGSSCSYNVGRGILGPFRGRRK